MMFLDDQGYHERIDNGSLDRRSIMTTRPPLPRWGKGEVER
jgi:hypothetical protein